MNKNLQKIWNVISTILVVIVVLCAVFLMGSRLLGYQCYTVISGSMIPTYEVGDLLYVKDVDVNSIKVGAMGETLNEQCRVSDDGPLDCKTLLYGKNDQTRK